MARQPDIARSLARIEELDIAVVSVGAWRPSGSALYNMLTASEAEEIADKGACGEISGRLFDQHGQAIESELDRRVLGISVDQLRRVPRVIGTGAGAYRAQATIAAAKAGLFNTLIVDRSLAQAILDLTGSFTANA
nr:sugar-binding domain-containing protein [Salinicola acroporae]